MTLRHRDDSECRLREGSALFRSDDRAGTCTRATRPPVTPAYARAVVEIRPADPSHVARIAEVLGRAFVTEPMMTWPLGGRSDDLEERCIRAYALFLGPLLDEGLVWETADGHGALVLVSPDQTDVWDDAVAHVDHSATHDVTGDGGLRHERFWEWVATKIPA
jgi:hypothetical protein